MIKRSLALILLAGCSDKGGDVGEFADSYCAMFTDCCRAAMLPTDGDNCHALVLLASATASYDASAGEQCLTELEAARSQPDFCTNFGGDPASCDAAFGSGSGTKAPGEPCTDDDECRPASNGDARCYASFDPSSSAQTRTCMVQRAGSAGDTPCVGTIDGEFTIEVWDTGDGPAPLEAFLCDTASNVRCDEDSHACAALQPVGGPCDLSDECVLSAHCAFDTNQCVADLAVGASCSGFDARCVDGAYCDSTTTQCTAELGANAACTTSQQCQSHSCVNGACASGGGSFGLSLICGS